MPHISRQEQDPAAFLRHCFRRPLGVFLFLFQVNDRDFRAFPSAQDCGRAADARITAGDKGHLIEQHA